TTTTYTVYLNHIPYTSILIYFHQTYIFYFSYYFHHRYLHSFPTRRSSDLFLSAERSKHAPHLDSFPPKGRSMRPILIPFRGKERSEEHTSELQSRGHLVCRLLLEKKKKIIIQS